MVSAEALIPLYTGQKPIEREEYVEMLRCKDVESKPPIEEEFQ